MAEGTYALPHALLLRLERLPLWRDRCRQLTAVVSPWSRILALPPVRRSVQKGRAAPEWVCYADRLLHSLDRTRLKGDPDPEQFMPHGSGQGKAVAETIVDGLRSLWGWRRAQP